MDFECQPKSYLKLFLILDKKNVPAQASKRGLKMESSTGDNQIESHPRSFIERPKQRTRRAVSPGLCACPGAGFPTAVGRDVVRAGQAGCTGSRQVRCWPHPPSKPGLLQKGIRGFLPSFLRGKHLTECTQVRYWASIPLCPVLLLNSACAFLRYYTPRPGCVCTARAQGFSLVILHRTTWYNKYVSCTEYHKLEVT